MKKIILLFMALLLINGVMQSQVKVGRVPTQAEWGSIFRGGTTSGAPGTATANTWTWNSSGTNGYKIAAGGAGVGLFLPAAGQRFYNDGRLDGVSTYIKYYSGTGNSGGGGYVIQRSDNGTIDPAYSTSRANACSVRCVSE